MLFAVVLAVAVSPKFWVTVVPLVLLIIPIGSVHQLSGRRKRNVYAAWISAVVAAFAGGAVLAAGGHETVGAVLLLAAMLSALVLIWVIRLS